LDLHAASLAVTLYNLKVTVYRRSDESWWVWLLWRLLLSFETQLDNICMGV